MTDPLAPKSLEEWRDAALPNDPLPEPEYSQRYMRQDRFDRLRSVAAQRVPLTPWQENGIWRNS